MDGGSLDKALDRIEAALSRIERAADRPAGDAPELQARHEQLKSAVARALGQIDDLIAEQQR